MNEVNSNCESEEGCQVIGEKLTIAFLARGVRIIEVYYEIGRASCRERVSSPV